MEKLKGLIEGVRDAGSGPVRTYHTHSSGAESGALGNDIYLVNIC
jgi:hypothetical protein